jgi:uncharacterized iron-regulated protein
MIRMVLLLITLLTIAGCSSSRAGWFSAASRQDMSRLSDALTDARVVFVGEYHDQSSHHDLQLKVIQNLVARGVPLVIGLEMFDMESQPTLDRWSQGELNLDEFTQLYRQNWTIAWAEYDQILLYARNQRIPLIGLNAPQDLVSRVSRFGWQSLRTEEKVRLPEGITVGMPDDYREFLLSAFVDHQQNHALFEFFCEAQGLRNNTMASLIQQAAAHFPGSTVVVLTGVGHAMRRGVATALGEGMAARTRIVVPYVESIFMNIDERDVDFIVTD